MWIWVSSPLPFVQIPWFWLKSQVKIPLKGEFGLVKLGNPVKQGSGFQTFCWRLPNLCPKIEGPSVN